MQRVRELQTSASQPRMSVAFYRCILSQQYVHVRRGCAGRKVSRGRKSREYVKIDSGVTPGIPLAMQRTRGGKAGKLPGETVKNVAKPGIAEKNRFDFELALQSRCILA